MAGGMPAIAGQFIVGDGTIAGGGDIVADTGFVPSDSINIATARGLSGEQVRKRFVRYRSLDEQSFFAPRYPSPVVVNSLGSQTGTSWSFTCSGTTRYLIVHVLYAANTGQTCTGVTYAGVPMVQLGRAVQSNIVAEAWGLVSPAVGSNTVAISYSATPDGQSNGAICLNNVDQTNPIAGSAGTATGTGSIRTSAAKTSAVGNLLVEAGASSGGNWGASGNIVELWNDHGGESVGTIGGNGASQTFVWSQTQGNPNWASVVVDLQVTADIFVADSAIVPLLLTPSSADLIAAIDSTTVPLALIPSGTDTGPSSAPISFTNASPDINSATDATSYTSPSWTPPSSGLILLAIYSAEVNGNNNVASVSGNGLTWTQIATVGWGGALNPRRTTLYAANASGGTTGAITVDFGGVTQLGCIASVAYASNVDLSGGVAAAFVQAVTATAPGSATSLTITMSSPANANNRPYSAIAHGAQESSVAETNWTTLDDLSGSTPVRDMITQYRTDTFDTTASTSWTSAVPGGGIAVELKAAGGGGGGTAYADSGTIPIILTASSSDSADLVDSSTVVIFDVAISTSETAQFVDSQTVPLLFTPSSADTAQYAEAATTPLLLTPSAVDIAQFVDSGSVLLDLQTTGADTAQFVDSQVVPLTLGVSSTELKAFEYTETATVPVVLTTSAIETAQLVDSTTVPVLLSASGTDIKAIEYTESASVYVALQSSAVETAQLVDATTAPLTLSVSGTDIKAFEYTDASAPYLDLDTSGTDVYTSGGTAYTDSVTVPVVFTPSSVELHEIPDAASVYVDLSTSDVQVFAAIDSGTGTVVLTPSSADVAVFTDAATAAVLLTPTSIDIAAYVEAATPYVDLQPSSTDIAAYVESATAPLVLTPSSSEVIVATDAVSVYLDLQASGTEVYTRPPQFAVPDGDVTNNGWANTPLYPKLSDSNTTTYIFAVAS